MPKSDWNATAFFESLCASNKLAQKEQFTFCQCSGLDGFEEAIAALQSATAICAVSDIADGYTELNNTPRTRRVKTIFLAMRHAVEDMDARNACMETMRELFRQFMSRLMLEKVRIEQDCIYIDPRITFNEIDRYFFSGCACAYFQIGVDVFTDLRHNANEWTDNFVSDPYDYLGSDIWLMDWVSKAQTGNVLYKDGYYTISEINSLLSSKPCKVFENVQVEDYEDVIAQLEYYRTTVKVVPNGQSPV